MKTSTLIFDGFYKVYKKNVQDESLIESQSEIDTTQYDLNENNKCEDDEETNLNNKLCF